MSAITLNLAPIIQLTDEQFFLLCRVYLEVRVE